MTNPTKKLYQLGQSLWLDNITREMLQDGTLRNYIKELSITGLTSNPSIFDLAIKSGAYDDSIHAKVPEGLSGEDLFFQLAGEDLIGIGRRQQHAWNFAKLEVLVDEDRDDERINRAHRRRFGRRENPGVDAADDNDD